MDNGVEELIVMLGDIISDARALPLSDKCIVERDKLLDIIDEIRETLPTELKQAKSVLDMRNDILANANREAERIVKAGEEKARVLVADSEIIRAAKAKSAEIIQSAESKSRELRSATNDYVDDVLKKTEDIFTAGLSEIKKSRQQFRSNKL